MRMKNICWCVFVLLCVGGFVSANGESLLKAASFPGVFNDAPFISRIRGLADGYSDFETIYDSNGHCVSGCAYPGITLAQETVAIEQNTQRAHIAAQQYVQALSDNVITNQNDVTTPMNTNVVAPSGRMEPHVAETLGSVAQQIANANAPTVNTPNTNASNRTQQSNVTTYTCDQHRLAYQTQIPGNSPLNTDIRITSDFGPRRTPTPGATSWHKGLDISVPVGTPVYATADGVIESIRDQGNSGGGKYIVIKHGNTNFRTVYMHLSKNNILHVGAPVQAGCLVGLSGNTGVSTGPHLHYAIYYTEPGKTFSMSTDVIDPLWSENRLRTNYRFNSQSTKSCLHRSQNFCGTGPVPPDTLPGEIK